MSIVPALLRRRRFYGVSPLAIYAVLGFKPELVLDFDDEKYFANSTSTTFSDALTHSASSNATMVDSDGLLKWRPHNLLTYSEQFDNAAVWVTFGVTVDGATGYLAPDGSMNADRIQGESSFRVVAQSISIVGNHTISVWVKSNTGVNQTFRLFGQDIIGSSDLVATNEWQKFTFSFTATSGVKFHGIADDSSGNNYDLLVWGAHLYRSDLGGMVNNPDQPAGFETYVPTTSSAVYLPRRGHHVYNGTSWVNEGLLVESEARTNLLTYSEDFTNAAWSVLGVTASSNLTASPAGGVTADKIVETSASGDHVIYNNAPGIAAFAGSYTSSVYLKAAERGFGYVQVAVNGGVDRYGVVVDLSTGAVTATNTRGTPTGNAHSVTSAGSGWWRISATTVNTGGNVYFVSGPSPTGTPSYSASATPSYTGDGTSGIYIYGAQLEAGPTPSSYIPNAGATSGATRTADTLTVPSANLPWPTPNVIGPELVTNGTFDNGSTGYTEVLNGTVSYAANTMFATGTTGNTGVYQDVACGVGVFEVSWQQVSGTQLRINIYDGAAFTTSRYNNGTGNSTTGSFSQSVVSTTGVLRIYLHTSAGNTAEFDNVSVREIDPLAVSIQMEGRATGDTLTTTRWYLDANNYITQEIGASDFTFEQAAFGTVDAVTGGSFTSGVNKAFNIASRHGSTFVNGAVDGTALTANTTPTALPDLSATDMNLAYVGGPIVIKSVRMWAADITDAGLEAATV